MAVDMFLKLEGVDGESKDDQHAGEIDILAWSWGMTQSGTFHTGGGGGAGKASIQDISITKYIDRASPLLARYCATGKHFASGVLVVRKAGGSPLEYVIIELDKILVSSVSTGGAGGEDRLTENVTLNFAKFNLKYVPQADDGSGEAPVQFGFDIEANKPV